MAFETSIRWTRGDERGHDDSSLSLALSAKHLMRDHWRERFYGIPMSSSKASVTCGVWSHSNSSVASFITCVER